jgi:hybrid cluster-associated redox disulfide protein
VRSLRFRKDKAAFVFYTRREDEMMADPHLSLNMSVAELLERHPETIPIFMQFRMACVGCDIAAFETVAEALAIYHINRERFAAELTAILPSHASDARAASAEESP